MFLHYSMLKTHTADTERTIKCLERLWLVKAAIHNKYRQYMTISTDTARKQRKPACPENPMKHKDPKGQGEKGYCGCCCSAQPTSERCRYRRVCQFVQVEIAPTNIDHLETPRTRCISFDPNVVNASQYRLRAIPMRGAQDHPSFPTVFSV
jgi:hypothetical protein